MIEKLHGVMGLAPASDRFAGAVNSDIINMEDYGTLVFYVLKGSGASGISKITVNSNSSASSTNASAIAFRYRAVSASNTDTWGTLNEATTAGFSTTADSYQMYAIEVNADDLDDGHSWVYLSASETTNSPVSGAVFALLGNPRYANGTDKTAIS